MIIEQQKTKYQAHINELAKTLNCKVLQGKDWPGMMYVELGYVEGPFILEEKDYFINLHELGHMAHKHTQGRPPHSDKKFYFDNGVLKSEAQAWDWALDQAMIKPSPETRLFMWNTCLGSYYEHYLTQSGHPARLLNGNRHYIEFIYDHPDKYFDSVVDKIQKDSIDIKYRIKYKGRFWKM